jgi:hypothetical protein
MAGFKEQSMSTKFSFNLSKTSTQTHGLLKLAFREKDMSRTETNDWFSNSEVE